MNKNVFAALLTALLGAAGLAQAAPAYTIQELGAGGSDSYAAAVNASGVAAGSSYYAPMWTTSTYSRAFTYSAGQITELGTLGAVNSMARDINDQSDVVGEADSPSLYQWRAFLYTAGAMKDLGTLGGSYAGANGINNLGDVVGYASTPGNESKHAFWYRDGAMQDLGTLGGVHSFAMDINENGQVVGTSQTAGEGDRAFVYEKGAMTALGALGGLHSAGIDINEAGEVVGYADNEDGFWRAFVYRKGQMFDLGTLGGTASWAASINVSGQIVGTAKTLGDVEEHGFLFSNDVMVDLNELIDPLSRWTIVSANGINDRGQIAATGFLNGVGSRALLLDPIVANAVPEPAMLGLLGFAWAGLVFSRRKPARY